MNLDLADFLACYNYLARLAFLLQTGLEWTDCMDELTTQ